MQLSHDMHANMAAKAQSRTSSSSGGTSVQYPVSGPAPVGQQMNNANSMNNNNNNSNTNNNNGNASANSNNNQKQEQRLTHEQVCILDAIS